jgi:hypothetical protein
VAGWVPLQMWRGVNLLETALYISAICDQLCIACIETRYLIVGVSCLRVRARACTRRSRTLSMSSIRWTGTSMSDVTHADIGR